MGNELNQRAGAPALPKRIWQSCRFRHGRLGIVEVTVRANSRRMCARRHGETVRLSVPPGVGSDQLMEFLEYLGVKMPCPDRLPHYSEGDRIDCEGASFLITRQRHKPRHILTTPRLPLTAIEVGADLDLESADVTRTITSIICKAARVMASQILLPAARELAVSLGVHPTGWTISSGHRILGHCDSKGVIALSCVLIFLPDSLRRFVICHELAHLSEMNHSERFHQLCNAYCGGREKELHAALKAFSWPIHRC